MIVNITEQDKIKIIIALQTQKNMYLKSAFDSLRSDKIRISRYNTKEAKAYDELIQKFLQTEKTTGE